MSQDRAPWPAPDRGTTQGGMSKTSPEGSLGPWPKFFWRASGLVLPAEGRLLQVSVPSPKSRLGSEAGAAPLAQSCTEPSVTPARCRRRSLVFLWVPAGRERGAGGGRQPPKGNQHFLSLGRAGEEPCLQRPARGTQRAKHASQGRAPGCSDSAGTGTAEGLPAAPRPGAALHGHGEMLHPARRPPRAPRRPEEQLALPGHGRLGPSAEGLRRRFPVPTSRSSPAAASEKNTNSQPFRPDSSLQQELSTRPQRQVQHLKERKKKKERAHDEG
ncbi:uncharacterized protein LOC120766092 isoform X2 [Hirundo rustica]|nr:uncharacterized protein LOC120766092 isoform X2 [Hirundo rustica]XP_058280244.1 uncharacterized protein LOC120766092 isoform X2 [Hirundo rustica]